MNYEVFSHSKYRNGTKSGDDATLLVPGRVAAVMDGATDPLGGQKNGKSPGQFAAYSVAQSCSQIFIDPANMTLPTETILGRLADELAANVSKQGFVGTPSTTLAIALFLPETVRLLTIGDSGIRLNGDKIYHHCKLIDDVSVSARVGVFSILNERISDLDLLEYTTRDVIFLGLEEAVSNGTLQRAEAQSVIAATQLEFAQWSLDDDIVDFLNNGIKSQSRFANLTGHQLGFSALNGTAPSLDDVMDVTLPIDEIKTLELFSDGYINLPKGRSIKDWEAEHQAVEQSDYHKIGAFRSVKGSTKTEYFDDRSIISIQL